VGRLTASSVPTEGRPERRGGTEGKLLAIRRELEWKYSVRLTFGEGFGLIVIKIVSNIIFIFVPNMKDFEVS
jgi:hypothetical protein